MLDLFSRRVVGWVLADHLRAELVLNALQMALGRRRPPAALVHHSDRGSQYASDAYRAVLREHGIVCSMSRRENCWDNAVVESFFATLKTELIHRRPWPLRRDATTAITEFSPADCEEEVRRTERGQLNGVVHEIGSRPHEEESSIRGPPQEPFVQQRAGHPPKLSVAESWQSARSHKLSLDQFPS